MMRSLACIFITALVVVAFDTTAAAQQHADLVGTYRCEGLSPAGDPYRAIVEISKDDETYIVTWHARGSPAIGIGILRNDTLSVSYFTGKDVGIVVYRIEKGPKLTGQWSILGADGQLYPEVLTKMGLDAEQRESQDPLIIAVTGPDGAAPR